MTYNLIDQSRTKGAPVILLLFKYGVGGSLTLGYTNSESPITYNSVNYIPVPLDTDAIKSKGVSGKTEFSIRVPNNSEISELFRFFPPPDPVTVTVFYGHRTDPDAQFIAVWTGKVLSAQPGTGLETNLTCEWAAVSLRRPGLYFNWQYTCPHDLYGSKCRANKAAATTVASVSAISSYAVTLPIGWNGAVDPIKYINGSASWSSSLGTEYRSIIDVIDDNVLILANVPRGLSPGSSITMTLGCDRTLVDCTDLHNNPNNFGGSSWIPTENPLNRDIYT